MWSLAAQWSGESVDPAAARVIIDELVRAGVNDVVLAPGSRSAPLAIEAARAHDRGDIRLHVRIDERSAGFLALGLAKSGGIPVPVITTSGTAVANLAPAVQEAFHSALPLLVITAHTPARRTARDGANQTIDQVRIFDGVVRWSVDMEAPHGGLGQVAYWRSTVARAFVIANHPWQRGPVHLNIGFREPLVPDGDDTWIEPLTAMTASPSLTRPARPCRSCVPGRWSAGLCSLSRNPSTRSWRTWPMVRCRAVVWSSSATSTIRTTPQRPWNCPRHADGRCTASLRATPAPNTRWRTSRCWPVTLPSSTRTLPRSSSRSARSG